MWSCVQEHMFTCINVYKDTCIYPNRKHSSRDKKNGHEDCHAYLIKLQSRV